MLQSHLYMGSTTPDETLMLENLASSSLEPEGNCGEELSKDSIERDERRLTELGRRTVEIFALNHIFSKSGFCTAERIGPIRPNRIELARSRFVIRVIRRAGRGPGESSGSGSIRSESIRFAGSATIRNVDTPLVSVPIRRVSRRKPFFPPFSPPFPLRKPTPDLHSRRPKEASYVDLKVAPKKGNSEDIGWQHGTALGSRHNYKCNYCGHTGQGGGVSCLKKHLAGGRLAGYHDVQGCKSVPAEVKRLMIEHLKGVRAETIRKRADRDMHERIISGRQRDEDDDDEPEIYAEYVPDGPDQPLRRTREQTRVESWEAEQRGSFEVGSGSGGSGSRVGGEAQSRRFSNVGYYFTHIPAEVSVPDQQQRQRKRSTAYYLHPAYHYAMKPSYDDDLTAAFTRVVERLSRSALDAADAIDQASINLPT
ncbi:hypothetical protein Taro_033466 [Colocasia esculenta]|uniref:BED-type domain-containing protein n=1 Tax=Colocasia esculenta TaxID=4460 RepID=A0A843W086_COLES|nr:hypothetical protein [Colocasia esculenta]